MIQENKQIKIDIYFRTNIVGMRCQLFKHPLHILAYIQANNWQWRSTGFLKEPEKEFQPQDLQNKLEATQLLTNLSII